MASANEKQVKKCFSIKNSKAYISAILIMGIFTFIFLGCEYLFVNMISLCGVESKAVAAQNYALGLSAIGFVLSPLILKNANKTSKSVITITEAIISAVAIILILRHISYTITLISGMFLFILLGAFGSAAIYKALLLIKNKKHLAKTVGISYMTGTLLQFINNNLITSQHAQGIILLLFIIISAVLMTAKEDNLQPTLKQNKNDNTSDKKPISAILSLTILVILITFIFSTLDNAVTLYHASGAMDIGQSPRILLALSGLLAGFLFDIKDRKYMSIIMYCVMILSTICLVIIQFSAPFLIGLIVFYLSAGFFAVFFTVSFMELAEYTKTPSLFAGLGRAINNITAAAITGGSLALLGSKKQHYNYYSRADIIYRNQYSNAHLYK